MATVNHDELLIDKSAQSYWVLTLNRPDELNALRTSLLRKLTDTLVEAQADDSVLAVVVTGGHKVFAAGADIKELASKSTVEVLQDVRAQMWRTISELRKPLIAAVNGYALGAGNELVLHCDIVVAGEDARFGQPEVNLGLMPGAGGSVLLSRAVGRAMAMKMALAGEQITAREALQAGLVSEVVAAEETIARATDLARKIARKAPVALQLIKETILAAGDLSLRDAKAYERKTFALTFATEDCREGMNAFIEKRRPSFKGR
ncbi:2,3-dehydroadipyl-CoA hydratase [compost metagenome]|jgi:enoyl-CoA hydratase